MFRWNQTQERPNWFAWSGHCVGSLLWSHHVTRRPGHKLVTCFPQGWEMEELTEVRFLPGHLWHLDEQVEFFGLIHTCDSISGLLDDFGVSGCWGSSLLFPGLLQGSVHRCLPLSSSSSTQLAGPQSSPSLSTFSGGWIEHSHPMTDFHFYVKLFL